MNVEICKKKNSCKFSGTEILAGDWFVSTIFTFIMLFPFLSVHWKGAAGEHQLVCASHNEPTVTVFVGTGWLAGCRCTCDGVTSAGDCVGYVRKHCISVVQLGAPWCTVHLEAAVKTTSAPLVCCSPG